MQLVLYSPYTGALFNCCTSGSPHDAASICLVIYEWDLTIYSKITLEKFF